MHYHPLGRTGLTVSALSLGTVSLGVAYGIEAPGAFGPPDENEAVALVRAAVDRGVTLVDTAPAYGAAERIVGRAVGRDPRVIVATKVNVGEGSPAIQASLESSLRALGRDALDVVQIHNATRETIESRAVADALLDAQRRGLAKVLGATVYDEASAMMVIRSGEYGVLQVALNVLDQRMLRDVIPAAHEKGVGVLARSAHLKGALTPKAEWLPDSLLALRDAAARARDAIAAGSWERLPDAAMRFCLSTAQVSSVLAGPRTLSELDAALAAEGAGPLDADTMARAARLVIEDDSLLNPSRWPSIP